MCVVVLAAFFDGLLPPSTAPYSLLQPPTASYSLLPPSTASYSLLQPPTASYRLLQHELTRLLLPFFLSSSLSLFLSTHHEPLSHRGKTHASRVTSSSGSYPGCGRHEERTGISTPSRRPLWLKVVRRAISRKKMMQIPLQRWAGSSPVARAATTPARNHLKNLSPRLPVVPLISR